MKHLLCCLAFACAVAALHAQPYQVSFWIATTTLAGAHYQSVQEAVAAQAQNQCAVRQIVLSLPKDRGCAFYVAPALGGAQTASALPTGSEAPPAPAGSEILAFTVNHPGNLRLDVGVNWTGADPGDRLKDFWCIVPFNQPTLIAAPAHASTQAAASAAPRRFYFLEMSGRPGLNDVTTQYRRQQLFNAHRMMMGPR